MTSLRLAGLLRLSGVVSVAGAVRPRRAWPVAICMLYWQSRHAVDLSAEVAQLVEHVTENHGVGSSILPLGTTS